MKSTGKHSFSKTVLYIMVVLIDLPVYIMHQLLQKWCSPAELIKLDSALCTNKLRTKFLRTIGSDQFVLLDVSFFRHPTLLLKWVFCRKVSVRHLRVETSTEIPRNDSLAKVTKAIHSLSLWEVPLSKQSIVPTILNVSPTLRRLSIYKCCFDSEVYSSISDSCSGITELNMTKVSISYSASKKLLKGFKHLTSIELSYGVFTNEAMLHIAYHCPHLKRFIYDEGLNQDSLVVYETKALTSEALAVICSMCTQLVHLMLHYDWDEKKIMKFNVVYSAITERLPLLRTLSICNVTIADNSGLETLITNLHQLRHVNVDADGLSNEGFLRLLYEHPKLRNVSLYLTYTASNSGITGVNTMHIPLQLNRLCFLELSKFTELTDDGMQSILLACHVINNLSISGAALITPDFVIPLIVQLCPRMKYVYFDECVQFTQGKITDILASLRSKIKIRVDATGKGFQYDEDSEQSDSDF